MTSKTWMAYIGFIAGLCTIGYVLWRFLFRPFLTWLFRNKRNPIAQKIQMKDNIVYNSGKLIYLEQFKVAVPSSRSIFIKINRNYTPKCIVDLSEKKRITFSDVGVYINEERLTFRRNLDWASDEFDIVKMLNSCNEFKYEDFDREVFILEINYLVSVTASELGKMNFLFIQENEDHSDHCEIVFKNGNKVEFNSLLYQKTLGLTSLIKNVVLIQSDGMTPIPFSINIAQRYIKDETECLSFWKNLKNEQDFKFTEVICQFEVSLKKNEIKRIRIHYKTPR